MPRNHDLCINHARSFSVPGECCFIQLSTIGRLIKEPLGSRYGFLYSLVYFSLPPSINVSRTFRWILIHWIPLATDRTRKKVLYNRACSSRWRGYFINQSVSIVREISRPRVFSRKGFVVWIWSRVPFGDLKQFDLSANLYIYRSSFFFSFYICIFTYIEIFVGSFKVGIFFSRVFPVLLLDYFLAIRRNRAWIFKMIVINIVSMPAL